MLLNQSCRVDVKAGLRIYIKHTQSGKNVLAQTIPVVKDPDLD
jgi:hypothetical protein